MKILSTKSKVFLAFQIIFTILTVVGGILLFIDKMDNAGMAVCCGAMSVAFSVLFSASKNK